MKFLSALLLFLTASCATITPGYVYECTKRVQSGFNLQDGQTYEWHHEAVIAKTRMDAVKFFEDMGNKDFYCTQLSWTRSE